MSIPPQHPRRSSLLPDHPPVVMTGGSTGSASSPHSAASHTTTTSQTSPNQTSAPITATPQPATTRASAPYQNGSSTSSSSIPAVPHVAWSPPSLLTSMASPQDYESATPRLLIAPPLTPGVSPPSVTTPSATTPHSSTARTDDKAWPTTAGTHESPGLTSPLSWLNMLPQDLHHFLQTVQGPSVLLSPMQELWDVQRAGGQPQVQANGVSHGGFHGPPHNGLHNGTGQAPQLPEGLEQDFWSDDEVTEVRLSTTGAAASIQTTQAGPSQGQASLGGGLPTPAQSIEDLVEQIAHDIGEDNPGSPGAAGSQAQAGTGSAASSSSTVNGPLVRTSQWSLPPRPGPEDRGSL